jgi:hypothetical protein
MRLRIIELAFFGQASDKEKKQDLEMLIRGTVLRHF